MTQVSELISLMENGLASEFTPYVAFSKAADAIDVYFRSDADYSTRLTDRITLFLSIDSNEIVGCRIEGVAEILEDLPN